MKRAALFIGINDYNEPLTKLSCAREDASELYQLFLKEYTPGLVHFLPDPDSDDIIEKIEYLVDQLDTGDLFLIYFSGHGIEIQNNHHLLSSKTRCIAGHWRHSVPMDVLRDITNKKGVQTIFILDSCRDSVMVGAKDAGVATGARGVTMKKLVEEKNALSIPPIVLCSCASGQKSFELTKLHHGIFTLSLLDTLRNSACVTLDDIAKSVTGKMQNLIAEHNLGGMQTPELIRTPNANPVLWGATEKEYVSVTAPAPEKKVESPKRTTSLDAQKLKTYFTLLKQVEKNIGDNAELAQEFENIKSLFKNGDQTGAYKTLQALQKKIEHLKLIKSYEEKLQALSASYPADTMAKYPADVDEYDVDSNVAASLYQSGNIADALKTLDEMEAIQKRVIAAEAKAEARPKAKEEAKKFTEVDCNGVKLEMVKIPAGTFMMGSPKNERGRYDDEKLHQVTLTKDYWLGKYQVTQAQWQAVMGNNPSCINGDDCPVEEISWNDAKSFCDKLNKRYAGKLPQGYKFDLPTEAQWEYACRAGTTTALNNGTNLTDEESHCSNLAEVAWYYQDEESETHPVGQKRPNNAGLYDMHGNVWEWCRDWYGDYSSGAVVDPVGPRTGSDRVYRGGSWFNDARFCRSASRCRWLPGDRNFTLGFRLALVPEQ